jgi:hypothetical protein
VDVNKKPVERFGAAQMMRLRSRVLDSDTAPKAPLLDGYLALATWGLDQQIASLN